MGNELAPFTETAVQTAFNWDEVFAETKELVKEDAELTATIDDAMVKRFHGRVKIGQNLLALQANHSKHRHGDFTTTVLPDLDIDKKFAYRCIGAANLVTQLENSIVPSLGQLNILDLPMPMDTWNRLASPSGQTVVKQLESGEIKPTQEDIKKALEEEKTKAAAEKQRNKELEEEAKRAKEEAKLLQRQLRLTEEEAEFKVQTKDQQLARINQQKKALEQKTEELEQKLETLQKPETVYATPQNVLDEIKALKVEILDLQGQKKLLSDEAKRLTEELWKQNDANEARRRQERREFEVKDACKKHTDTCYQSLGQYVAQKPMPKDTRFYSEDEWARYDQIEEALRYALEVNSQIKAMRYNNQIIESAVASQWPSDVVFADTTLTFSNGVDQ